MEETVIETRPEPSAAERRGRIDEFYPSAIALLGGAIFGAGFNLALLPGAAGWLSPVLAMVGLGLMLRSLRSARSIWRGALLGLLGNLAAAAVALFWMNCITAPAYVGIVLYLGIYGAAFGALAALLRRNVPAALFPWLAAALWVALEWVRTWAFTGFPWMLAGSVWAGVPAAMGPADLGGIYLVSFLTVLVPALAVAERPERRWARAAIAAGVALAALGYGRVRLGPSSPPAPATHPRFVRIAAVQPLVPFKVGPNADRDKMLDEQLRITAGLEPGSTDLLVWSETMVPGDLVEQTGPLLAPLAREKRCCLLAGGVVHERKGADGNWTGKAWNSAVLISPQGELPGRYDKRHLVPFGEYVPFGGRFPGADAIFRLIGTIFTPGDERALVQVDDVPFAANICYEDCFPYLMRRDVRRGAQVVVNLTNDSWFRQSSEARQHLALAAFRAVETRTPLVRATNTGITALVDADGRITQPPEGGLWKKGLVRMEVPLGVAPRLTVFVALGEAFAWLCALVAAAGVGAGLFRRQTSGLDAPRHSV